MYFFRVSKIYTSHAVVYEATVKGSLVTKNIILEGKHRVLSTSHVPGSFSAKDVLLSPSNQRVLERLSLKDCAGALQHAQAGLVKLMQGESGANLRFLLAILLVSRAGVAIA